jgi:hypothetical protein
MPDKRMEDSIKEDRALALAEALGWFEHCKRDIAAQEERLSELLKRIDRDMGGQYE